MLQGLSMVQFAKELGHEAKEDDISNGAAVLAYYLMLIVYRIGVRNVMWSAATFDDKHRLVSDVPRFRYAWILISNTVLTIASFGLLRPWAAVRERRFIVAFTGLWIMGDVGELQAQLETSGNAFGSEFLDSDGFDIGF